jgi:hypothetical protein
MNEELAFTSSGMFQEVHMNDLVAAGHSRLAELHETR